MNTTVNNRVIIILYTHNIIKTIIISM